MSHMTDKIRELMFQHAPYSPELDPPILVFYDGRQHKSSANQQGRLPELNQALSEILDYVKTLEEEVAYLESRTEELMET